MAMKKTQILIVAAILFSLGASAKNDPGYFVKKLSRGKEIMELQDNFYTNLFLARGGDMMIESISSDDGVPTRYCLGTSVVAKKQVTVNISSNGKTRTYALSGGDNGIWNYSTMIREATNPDYLSDFFGNRVAIRFSLGADETVETEIYAPKAIAVKLRDKGKGVQSPRLGLGGSFQWDHDPQNRNGIIISVSDGSTNCPHLLLTPDDGTLSVSDLRNYIPANGPFTVKFHRLEYKIVNGGTGKKYKFMSQTSASYHYTSAE